LFIGKTPVNNEEATEIYPVARVSEDMIQDFSSND
jgi:hypothetical protein